MEVYSTWPWLIAWLFIARLVPSRLSLILKCLKCHGTGFRDILFSLWFFNCISKIDLWLTLLTRLIWISPAYPWLIWILSYYFLTPRTSKHSRFWYRALSHPAPYSCYLLYPNSTNLVILVHFRLATSLFGRTHKSIFISGNMVHFSYSYPVTQSW